MARNQIILRPGGTATVYRRQQPLLRGQARSSSGRIAEVAGGTAAECAAVWCCCPCAVVNLLVLGLYKVPAGICRKALRRRRRRRLIKRGLLPLPGTGSATPCACHAARVAPEEAVCADVALDLIVLGEGDTLMGPMDEELMELERQMWDRFYSTGFWRSPSQREL